MAVNGVYFGNIVLGCSKNEQPDIGRINAWVFDEKMLGCIGWVFVVHFERFALV